MDTIHERQRKILKLLSSSQAWLSITEIDSVLFNQGLKHSRRTIARDLDHLEHSGLISQSKNKNRIEYKIAKSLEIDLSFTQEEAKSLLSHLEALPQQDIIQSMIEKLRAELGKA